MPSQEKKSNSTRRIWIQTGLAVFVIGAFAAVLIYWIVTNSSVYIDTAMIQAPIIDLSPTTSGVLQQVFVGEGDAVSANEPVAQVGTELVDTTVAGIISSVPGQIGAEIQPGEDIVEMIDPTQLRVVGKIDENKGLSNVQLGDPVIFTVDAFGGQQFTGIVDDISPTSIQSGVVFNISDSRPTEQFAVEARFDTEANPQLKNGMSARMWIYPQQQ